MTPKLKRTHPKMLIVEGKDELRVLPELLELAGIPWPKGNEPVRIDEQDGITNILAPAFLETTLKASGVKTVGVIVDANGNPAARWAQIRARFAQIFGDFPSELPATGVIHEVAEQPRVGVWLMPDNVRSGMLESLLLGLRAGNPALHEHARAAVEQARQLDAPFLETHREKAELHTWLAWEDPPGRQLHEAVRSKSLPPMPATSGPFVAWFRALFDV